MAKKIKFPLDMGNEVMVRSIEELKENYNAEKVTEYFLNGQLLTWLEDRYYDDEAEQIRELAKQSNDGSPAARLGAIFGIKTEEDENGSLIAAIAAAICSYESTAVADTDLPLKPQAENPRKTKFFDRLRDLLHGF